MKIDEPIRIRKKKFPSFKNKRCRWINAQPDQNKNLSLLKKRDLKEPTMRFELTTSSLPRKRSTPELSRREIKKKSQAAVLVVISVSGRRGSNSRHSAWKADALPTELLPHFCFQKLLVNGLQI